MDVEPLNDDEDLVWRNLMRLVFTLPRALGDDLQRTCGLSSTEYSVLMHLSESPERQLSMSELADRTNLSPSRISRVIAEMARLRLVERRPGSADGRITIANLTSTGAATLRRAWPHHLRSVRERAFDRLTSEEVRTLGPLLARLAEAGDDSDRRSFAEPRRQRWRLAVVIVGLAYVVFTVVVLIINAAGLADALGVVRTLQPWWVGLALVAVVARHGFYSLQVGLLGQRAHGLDRRTAVALELIVYGLGAVTPVAPAEGLALASMELRRRGFSRREVMMTLGFSEWFTQQLFYEVAAANVIVVVSVGHLSFDVGWPLVILAGFVITIAGVLVVALARPAAVETAAMRVGRLPLLRGRISTDQHASAMREWCDATQRVVGTARLRAALAWFSALSVIADGAVMWAATHAAGVHLPFDVILLATTAGVLAGLIPFLPGGIGVVDAAIPAVLHHYGVTLEDAVAITIVYRALTLVLPMLAGVGSLLWLRRDDRRRLAR